MIAALYVQTGGCYFGLPDVDPWNEARDARLYAGPHAVVAHPPCTRWCRLAGLVEARWGHQRGDDGGCFAAALTALRKWGGVLEHPAYSAAWPAHDLPTPDRHGGWSRDSHGGWSAQVEQGRYGHPAKKATWLYAVGAELPDLRWGFNPDHRSQALVSWCGNTTRSNERRPRLRSKEASATPAPFRDVLIAMARSVAGGARGHTELALGLADGGARGRAPHGDGGSDRPVVAPLHRTSDRATRAGSRAGRVACASLPPQSRKESLCRLAALSSPN